MNALTSEQRNFIIGQLYFNRINEHKFHPHNNDFGPLNSEKWLKVFGGGYKKYISEYFEVVDNNFIKGGNGIKGITKAYKPLKKFKQAAKLLRKVSPSVPLPNNYKVLPNKQRFEEVLSGAFKVEKQHHLIPVQFLYKRINEDGFIYETYQRTFGKGGRRFVIGCGVQQLPSYLRSYLFPQLNDYDMANALPTILNQLLKSVRYDTLNQYARKRDTFFEQTFQNTNLTYKEQKKTCLAVMFGAMIGGKSMRDIVGDMHRLKEALPNLIKLKEDLHNLGTVLSWDLGYADLWEKSDYNNKRFLALVAQYHEDKILQSIEKYCEKKGHRVDVLMFDGFMSEDEIDLNDLESFIYRDTDFRIKMVNKSQTKGVK
jgi:hypothetical protein